MFNKKKSRGKYEISQTCGNCGATIYTTVLEHIKERQRFYDIHPESDFSAAVPICDKCVRRMQKRLNKELKRIDKERSKNDAKRDP